MERVDLTIGYLEIDSRKAAYVRSAHGIEPEDVYEVLYNAPAFFLFNPRWGNYDMIGPTRAGRFLVVGIQRIEGNNWRVITAYWNDDGRAARLYLGG